MYTLERLQTIVQDRLGGDMSRLAELFQDREVFDLLKAKEQPADWYHFEHKTLDGEYLVETPSGFQVYQQDRGVRCSVRDFGTLQEAACTLFA